MTLSELSRSEIAMRRFGEVVREARKKKGFSQSCVATALGYQQDTHVSNIENGVRRIPVSKMQALSAVLGIPTNQLINLALDIDRALYYDSLEAQRDAE